MMINKATSLLLVVVTTCQGLTPIQRREAFSVAFSTLAAAAGGTPALALEYEARNRNGNKQAIVREDYYYMMGRAPPRRMEPGMMKIDNPQYNAWGSCDTETGNSCTYVSLKQRVPAYSKYSFSISAGLAEYAQVKTALDQLDWATASKLLVDSSPPPPAIDALLKMVLFATQMLTTPNYTGLSKELLVARFYVNEASFAITELREAIKCQDMNRAMSAWDFGRDSFNSYLTIVNRNINDKVGDKLVLV
jgi:hypothetical protein